jgi:HEPN domain-containing protein
VSHDPVERSRDWFRQAERDLQHARNASDDTDYEWACFASQQAAEKSLKALYQALAGEGWGHSVLVLLEGLESRRTISDDLKSYARLLDRMYIPTRYPNGFDSGIPGDYFGSTDAEEAIRCAGAILEFARPEIP